MAETAPDATGQRAIEAAAGTVYRLITDLDTLAELAGELHGHRWLGRAREAEAGAKFLGSNRRGWRRWVTVATVTDATAGERFAFDVDFGPMPVARWRYDIAPHEAGCLVTESTWDRRPKWLRPILGTLIGPKDRAATNRANINATLDRLKARAEIR
ncbi:MAG: SRPBCC family protein [Actinophytocola sp.]|nr:SRPBCC family protein [Actinophytocola sp.]